MAHPDLDRISRSGYSPQPGVYARRQPFYLTSAQELSEAMGLFYTTLYCAVGGVVFVQALLLILQAWEHRRYARSCLASAGRKRSIAKARIFVPCKGMDVDLQSNLQALLQQDYEDFEVTFVVESDDDPACRIIAKAMDEQREVPTRLIVAGKSFHTGQKVHNLRAATAKLSLVTQVLVFVDSDARPRTGWLRAMVASLNNRKIGAVTGYRWFIPQRSSLANRLLHGINSRIASLLGKDSHYLVWGGSWAIRREVFEKIGLRDAWKGTLSDDLVASRVLRQARLGVRFEPACMAGSPCNYSFREMFAFMRRQYMVGRFYTPGWWTMALTMATLNVLFWVASLAMMFHGLATGTPALWIPVALCAGLYVLGLTREAIIRSTALAYFPDKKDELQSARLPTVWAAPAMTLVNWLGLVTSAFGRHISWRGITYGLRRGGQIHSVSRYAEPRPTEQPAEHDRMIIPLPEEDIPRRKAG